MLMRFEMWNHSMKVLVEIKNSRQFNFVIKSFYPGYDYIDYDDDRDAIAVYKDDRTIGLIEDIFLD